ncbi:lipoprotein [Rhodocyclaceae bacterium]
MKRRASLLALPTLLLAGCVSGPEQFVKGDIDRIADLHRREASASLQRLAEKLYRRNPREWKKGGHASLEAALAQLADPARFLLLDAEGRRSTTLVLVSLREDYAHDRVAAFVGGLAQMLHLAFDGKREFYLLDDLNAQKLYNAARNLEIAAWKLSNALRTQPEVDIPVGAPILFSNETTPLRNLSFEREFGRLIGNLDLLSQIVADKTQRTVVKAVQSLTTAIFLPI